MKYLFKYPHKIKNEIKNKFVFLFLDYDGTLAPIVDTPDKAVIPKKTKNLLERLSHSPNCRLAVISARAIKDVMRKIGLANIIYAGNHGLELKGPKIKFKSPVPLAYRKILNKIKQALNEKISSIKGAFVEDKGLSLSLHYRLVDEKERPYINFIFREIAASYLANNGIKIESAKMCFEVRPAVNWDKGKVVSWLLAREKFLLQEKNIIPIYIGDDLTDEDAFKVLKNRGITIFVGKPDSRYHAEYYLKGTDDVRKFLQELLEYTIQKDIWHS